MGLVRRSLALRPVAERKGAWERFLKDAAFNPIRESGPFRGLLRDRAAVLSGQ